MERKISLLQLETGESGIIDHISDKKLSSALLRFGITKGTTAEALMYSPLGRTRAYCFSSFILALRNGDAEKIIISRFYGGVGSG